MTEAENQFTARALRRKRLFLTLSIAGLVVAAGLASYYTWRKAHDPAFPIGARVVIVVLVLLNARQNLRQYRFAGILESVLGAPPGRGAAPPGGADVGAGTRSSDAG